MSPFYFHTDWPILSLMDFPAHTCGSCSYNSTCCNMLLQDGIHLYHPCGPTFLRPTRLIMFHYSKSCFGVVYSIKQGRGADNVCFVDDNVH